MLGAILGDIIGSPYEFSEQVEGPDAFPLFSKDSRFTDDTVLTLAVANGILEAGRSRARTADAVKSEMQRLGKLYPDAGYGARFIQWLESPHPRPYQSWGNGSAMRVSSVGWMFESMSDVMDFAEITSSITHNSQEGIKGAQAVAGSIFLAREGASKRQIRSFLEHDLGYDFSEENISYLRIKAQRKPGWGVSCMATVPLALDAFSRSQNFEGAVREAIAGGVDTDTVADIAGAVAEAYYGIPFRIRQKGLKYLDASLLQIYNNYLNCIDA